MGPFECFYEMTPIVKATSRSDLFDTEERVLQELLRPFQPNVVNKAHNRCAGLFFE